MSSPAASKPITPARTDPSAIGVVIAGDHPLFLEALGMTLNRANGIEVLALALQYDDVPVIVRQAEPSVLLLGESSTSGEALRVAEAVRAQEPRCRIALMAAAPTGPMIEHALAAGVLGILPKTARIRQLIGTIKGVAAGCMTVDPRVIRAAEKTQAKSSLNGREEDVLRLTATGATIKEIAAELFLAAGTVRNVASTAIHKLGGRNRFDAARIAFENGWL